MSTPTPSQLAAVPSPASKKPGIHSVSTPGAHNLSSPAPRSVPSPATTRRDLSGKTPLGNGSNSSKTVGGTPMMLNLSQQGSTVSPMPASFTTPLGLGVDLGTPDHLNMPTPAFAVGMKETLSELGTTISAGLKRNEDEERRTKMRKILKTIGRPKGRVGEEGILHVTRRLGLANDIDGETLRAEERERRVGNRTIGIAGNTLVVEVELQNHIPKDVRVDFSNTMANASGKAEQAGSILLSDLSLQKNAPQVNKSLDQFAFNLDRLARLDRLSTPKISCFGALAGLYSSFKRLYDQELDLATKLYHDDRRGRAEAQVTNKGSGRPAIHEDGRTGLSLTYRNEGANKNGESSDKSLNHKIWIETEHCSSELFPPIRITDAWLPEPLQLSAEATSIPWTDPPPTYILPDTDGNSMSDDPAHPLPDIRFVAKFDPPLVLPWQIAANLHTAVQSTIPQVYQLPSYIAMLLDAPSGVAGNLFTTHAQVLRRTASGSVDVKHTYKINVVKHELGYRLEELPFSHPRQIVELLPVLRQWLGINSLLLQQLRLVSSLSPRIEDRPKNTSLLASLLAGDGVVSNELAIEVVLVLAPQPTLALTFALADGTLHNADVQVLSNGELQVVDAQFSNATEALNLCGDLGVWLEWLRARKMP
ncbi:hypothetical protein AMS68_006223 [Peltaster fructicola]|uniref:Mediator of RNA polymerase II transcription subunit 1 n=1 Tax=Peltaster fructicola TaxID=286661 RepID=A0A6H0Y190_9PEZI|nr:hypothetical protein AMS68_006223 [Peltaster fructicola]